MGEKKRIIMHLDMDHFFTAIEEREHPELKGKPVIVGADPKEGKGRGVVQACNYEARKFGVRSAMPISRAWKLCPTAVYLRPNYDLYVRVSNEIMDILRGFSDKFEQWSIDEAFLDATSKVKDYVEAQSLALRIKDSIYEKQKLTCSIGIGPNKLVAKIASDYKKPNGLTTVKEEEAERFLTPLPVRKLLWVGRKTERRLLDLGIRTIGDLARSDPALLAQNFGAMGTRFHSTAHGVDESEVEERTEIKSVSRDTTFEEDTSDREFVLDVLDQLSEDIIKDVDSHGYFFKTVTIRVRYENFETHTHGRTLPAVTHSLKDLRKAAGELMRGYLVPDRRIRLVGLRVSNLTSLKEQKTLF